MVVASQGGFAGTYTVAATQLGTLAPDAGKRGLCVLPSGEGARGQPSNEPRLVLSRTTAPVVEGGTETFTVELATEPTADVTVTAMSQDASVVSVSSGSSLTFTTSNWDTAQTVTVAGVQDNDTVDDTAVVDLAASGGGYESVTGAVTVEVDDDDSVGLSLSRTVVPVDEGDSETFTVELSTQPTADVTVSATSRDTSVVSVTGGSSLTFTTVNWDTAQTVTVFACARQLTPSMTRRWWTWTPPVVTTRRWLMR